MKKKKKKHRSNKKKPVPGWYVKLKDGRHGHIKAGSGSVGNSSYVNIEITDGKFEDCPLIINEKEITRLYIINLTWADILKTG